MIIRVVSKTKFDNFLSVMNITDQNVDQHPHLAFISIRNSKYDDAHYFIRNHKNVLNLMFDDCTPADSKDNEIFTEEHADRIIEFMEKNAHVKFMYIHCAAGISRSGAVGLFINDLLGEEDYFLFKKGNPLVQQNAYIASILKSTLQKRYEGDRSSQQQGIPGEEREDDVEVLGGLQTFQKADNGEHPDPR